MRKTSTHLKLTITFILCFCLHINIKAAFIEHPNTVIDTANNLEWYKHDLTPIDFTQMVSNFSNPASPFFGFRHATSSEIIDLWKEAGITIVALNDPLVVDAYLDIFGSNFGNGQYSQFVEVDDEFILDMDGAPVGIIPGHREIIHIVGSGGDFAHDPGSAHLFRGALDDIVSGQAIVRAVVPEPSTYLMFATFIGFAGIFSYRKNKNLKGVN